MSYFNTTHAAGPVLMSHQLAAGTQDDAVLNFFKARREHYSPSQVHRLMIINGNITSAVPLTSIRRTISNLTRENKLEKTDKMCDGPYGRKEHKWKLSSFDS